jgi:hypothetical protein
LDANQPYADVLGLNAASHEVTGGANTIAAEVIVAR